MSKIIVACQTISDELKLAIKITGVDYPVLWVESGLHNYPERLRARIQDELDRIDNVSTIILGFGFCGTALLGVKAKNAQLVAPRVHDCIALLLGSSPKRNELAEVAGTYFLTKGWIEHESSLCKEYKYCLQKFGLEKTAKIIKIMFSHYSRLVLVNTGAYNISEYKVKTEKFAALFGLQHLVVDGTLDYFRKLLVGPWDDGFIILEAGEEISFEHMMMGVDGPHVYGQVKDPLSSSICRPQFVDGAL